MGHKVKISDQNKKWFLRSQEKQGRICDVRSEREYILIICEGEKTEPNYFKAINRILPKNIVEISIHGEGANTLSLVEKAQQLRDNRKTRDIQFDQVWIVFDRDSFSADNFNNAIHKAESLEMRCAWSNEAFEFWYILHFEFRDTGMVRDDYKAKLSSPELLNESYRKNDSDMYEKLRTKGNQEQAIKWAKKLHEHFQESDTPPANSNPCTTIYELIEELNKFII